MTFEIEIAGRLRVVSVEAIGAASHAGGRFRVALSHASPADGSAPAAPNSVERFEVDARLTDLGLSIVYDEDRRSVDVAVTDRAGGEYLIQLPHVSLTALVDRRRFQRERTAGGAGKGEERVMAPMPGRILRVLIKPGDRVEARQGLVVIEAMKMENELVAARPGRVREVTVSEGTSVEAGRVLVVIDDALSSPSSPSHLS